MHTIVGLGNSGSAYSETRHNTGFAVVDAFAEALGATFRPGKGEYWFAEGEFREEDLLLVKPTTMMNNSGIAVRDVLERYGGSIRDLLIVYDDIHLPLGTLRFRARGSDGGHNGMGSIIYHLESEELQRLRCGVGNEEATTARLNTAEFVLAPFLSGEREQVREMVCAASDAIHDWLDQGIDAAMNRWNPQHEE